MNSYIILNGGDELEYDAQTNDGVMTDVGLIPWNQILAFCCYCKSAGRWMTIPIK